MTDPPSIDVHFGAEIGAVRGAETGVVFSSHTYRSPARAPGSVTITNDDSVEAVRRGGDGGNR